VFRDTTFELPRIKKGVHLDVSIVKL